MRVHVFPKFIAFVRVGLDLGIVELAPVKRTDELHVALARNQFRLDFRIERTEFPDEGGHAHNATSAGACVRFDMRCDFFSADFPILKNVPKILVHAVCDSLVLGDTYLREVSFARGGIGGEDFCVCQRLFTEFGQFACGIGLGKSLVEEPVFVCVVVVAATVPSVMADIERLVSGGNLCVFNIYGFRVHEVIARCKFGMF